MSRNISVILILWSLLLGCRRMPPSVPSSEYMMMKEVKYISSFPRSYQLQEKEVVNVGVLGATDFVILDSLFVISTSRRDGFWSFVSTENFRQLGTFLQIGEGPEEFVRAATVSRAHFFRQGDKLFAALYDFYRGKLCKVDISETLATHRLSMTVWQNDLPKQLFNFVAIDSVTCYCREINATETQQNRYIWKNGEREVTEHLEDMNLATIRPREDFNLLSAIVKRKPDEDLLVEASVSLNQINLFSLSTSLGKTICVGDCLDNLEDIQSQMRWNRKYTYGGVQTYTFCFAVLCVNETNMLWQTGRRQAPSVQLFDWEGNPLVELKLDVFANAFAFDFAHGYLYVLDNMDEFYRYDVREMVGELSDVH